MSTPASQEQPAPDELQPYNGEVVRGRRGSVEEARALDSGSAERSTTLSHSGSAERSTTLKEARFHELDVLRGLAAIAVVYCHFISQCHQLGRLPFEFRWGSYGPHLFFMISGFVIFMTLNHCRRPMDFVFSRFSRLYPMYWMGVLCSTLVIVAVGSTETSLTVKQFLINLTMLQTWLKVPDIEVAYWTLGVELKFYGLMFIVLWLRKSGWIEWLSGGWLVAVIAYRCVDSLFGLPNALSTPLILDYAQLFVAGIMFYRLRCEGESYARHALISASIPLAFIAEGTEVACFTLGFVGVFYLFLYQQLVWLNFAPLRWLGSMSYALYLVHGALGYAMINALHAQHMPTPLLLTLPTIVCLALSAVLTNQFEQPLLKRMRQWYRSDAGRTPVRLGNSAPELA